MCSMPASVSSQSGCVVKPDVHALLRPPARYLGDERFQLALSVGLGMNIMGGDQFRQQAGACKRGRRLMPASQCVSGGLEHELAQLPLGRAWAPEQMPCARRDHAA